MELEESKCLLCYKEHYQLLLLPEVADVTDAYLFRLLFCTIETKQKNIKNYN